MPFWKPHIPAKSVTVKSSFIRLKKPSVSVPANVRMLRFNRNHKIQNTNAVWKKPCLVLIRAYFSDGIIKYPPFSKVYPSNPITENLTLSSIEEFEAMLHLTFVNDFTVSNNSFQSSAYPIPYLQNLNSLLLKSNPSYFFPILIIV